MIFCEHSCGPGWTVSAIVLTLGIVQCITGCSGCCWVTSSSSQVITNIKTSVRNFIPIEFVFFFDSLDNTVYVLQFSLEVKLKVIIIEVICFMSG